MDNELMLFGISLAEKQQYFYNASHCIYCGEATVYVDSIEVYRESYGMIHLCRPCKAHVGCLPNSDQSMGTVAKKRLRDLRIETHQWYDPLIEVKAKGSNWKVAQIQARKWLAEKLNVEVVECHVGYFTIELCQRTIDICKEVHEQLRDAAEKKEIVTQERVGAFIFSCARLKLEPKFFNINGFTQYELPHPGKGQLLKYKPRTGEIQWDNGKWKPVEDIQTFILENFKTNEDGK